MIDPKNYGLVEMAIFGAVALGVAFWQLWSVRDAGKPKDKPDDSPIDTRHPEG